jgi:hypothetical protein
MTLKRYRLFILSLLITFTFVVCIINKGMTKPPEISITVGDKKVGYVVGLNQWNGAKYDRLGNFNEIMKANSDIQVPYIHLGETIQIEIRGRVPDTFQLKDYILKENGEVKYTEKKAKEILVEFINRKGTFELDSHIPALLSSDSKDYEQGKTIRGFSLTCSWGQNECEYGFIIRTDAKQ